MQDGVREDAERGREGGDGLPLRRTAGDEISGDSEGEEAVRDGGPPKDQIGSAAAQGTGAQVRAERLTRGKRLSRVGPWLITAGIGSGQEIDIAGDGAILFARRGVEFIGIEGIGMPDVAL